MANLVEYVKTVWENGKTALNAARMNNMEKGISDCATQINKLGDSVFKVYAINVNDLDNPPAALILNTSTVTKGYPSQFVGNSCLVLQHNIGNSIYRAQLAFGFGSDKIAIRRKNGSTQWTDWKYVALS